MWLPDGPVVIEINENRYEFTVFQLDEFSLTINSFELSEKLDWYGWGNEMPLIWKENIIPKFENSLKKEIIEINILTYDFCKENLNDDYTIFGIEFVLKKESESDFKNFFTIYNGLDENKLTNTELQIGNQIRRLKITSRKN